MRAPRLIRNTGFRFALLYTLVFVLSVCAIGWLAKARLTADLLKEARDRVTAEAAALVTEFRRHGMDELRSAIDERRSGTQRLHFAITDAQGHVVFGDHYLAQWAGVSQTGVKILSEQPEEAGATDQIMVASSRLRDGQRLLVADNLETVEDVESVIFSGLFVALGLAVVLGLGAGALLSRFILHRVENVTNTAEAIIGGDLTRRIAVSGSGDDFDRLAATLNRMLDRITDLMQNLHQVSNDIAHDLRTPLSRLRQRLEETRLHAASMDEYAQSVDQAIEQADGLLDTFAALLRIAQIEAGMRRASFRPVNLSDVMATVADAYGPAVEDQGKCLQTEIAEGITVSGDRELLVQLFANLVENALRHTPPGTRIVMRLVHHPKEDIAEVADNGPGIPEQERARVFRRFYRLEDSRTTPGNGLGLSLVAAVVDLHGAKSIFSTTIRD